MASISRLALHARARLEAAGVPPAEAQLDAELLLRHVLGWTRAQYLERTRDEAAPDTEDALDRLVNERAKRRPVQHLTGVQEFWSLAFEVTPEVLIPRPETEFVVEVAIDVLRKEGTRTPRIADVGTGCGCIAVAIAREIPDATVDALDSSAPALEVARRNAGRHAVGDRIRFAHGHLLDPLRPAGAGTFDCIVSNPPYVPSGDLAGLPPEVRDHEPREALDGGADGLDVIREMVPAAAACLKAGGHLVLEIGFGQDSAVRDLVRRSGEFASALVRPDLQGIPRTLLARRR